MAKIPKINLVKQALEEGDVPNNPRSYLGYSGIGEVCIRKLQYSLRMAYTSSVPRRIGRLFNFGHYMEDVFIADLKRIGVTVTRQQEEIIGFAGHWKGHIDGVAVGVPGAEKTEHLAEFKTMKASEFAKLVKADSVKISHRGYYDQATMYMGSLGLKRTLFISYCKDDSDYYVERIYFNENDYKELQHKEKAVIFQEGLAPRIGTGQITWHECRFCDAKSICFNKEQPVRNCRTCQYVTMEDEGKWKCGNTQSLAYQMPLGKIMQKRACSHYQLEEILDAS